MAAYYTLFVKPCRTLRHSSWFFAVPVSLNIQSMYSHGRIKRCVIILLILHTDSYHSIITNLKNAVHLLYYLTLHQKSLLQVWMARFHLNEAPCNEDRVKIRSIGPCGWWGAIAQGHVRDWRYNSTHSCLQQLMIVSDHLHVTFALPLSKECLWHWMWLSQLVFPCSK